VIRLNPSDDVVIACQEVPAGTPLAQERLTVRDAIPAGHKIAVRNIAASEPVRRYNQIIGFATKPISPGEHVHVHNLEVHAFERDYAFCVDPSRPHMFVQPQLPRHSTADGRVATRNYLGFDHGELFRHAKKSPRHSPATL
jgi:altronate hydrolase